MRGPDIQQDSLFSTADPDARVPKDHPLRSIRTVVDVAQHDLDSNFDALYSSFGRDSIPPEKLLLAQLVMAFYTIRTERQLMEQTSYSLLFRWFVGFSMDDEAWGHSAFTKNRDCFLGGEVAQRFFAQVLRRADRTGLLSKEHFSVDGTPIETLASPKSYRPKGEDDPPSGGGRDPGVDYCVEQRSRNKHEPKTDKDDLLFNNSNGTAVKLSYMGRILMENSRGLVGDAQVTKATGTAEREAAVDMVGALSDTHHVTLGTDKNYDTHGCVDDLRCTTVRPDVVQKTSYRGSATERRAICHSGYATSQIIRKRIEECFGWAKTISGLRKRRSVGREKLDFQLVLTFATYNLIRMRNLGVVPC